MKKAHKTPDEIRGQISQKIIEAIEKGTPPWRQPWMGSENSGTPRNFASKRRYTGINTFWLWLAQEIYGFSSRDWGTGAAWMREIGCHIKKGETASYAILFKHIPMKDKLTGQPVLDTKGKQKTIPIMREFPLFNVNQLTAPAPKILLGVPSYGIVRSLLYGSEEPTKGEKRVEPTTVAELLKIAARYLPANEQPNSSQTREEIAQIIHDGIEKRLTSFDVQTVVMNSDPDFKPAEKLIKATGIKFEHRGNRACWNSATDKIMLPPKRSFVSMTDYYQTVAHEMVHWTQRDGRVGQKDWSKLDTADSQFVYAFNELVAELGASIILAEIGVPKSEKMLPQTAAYVESWLKAMKGDTKYIFEAASWASKAADYLLNFVGKKNPPYEEPDVTEHEEEVRREAA